MGVDWYVCQNEECKGTYPDCGEYFTCSTCESNFCWETCGGKQKIVDEHGEPKLDRDGYKLTTCILCRREQIRTQEVLDFLLKRANLTRSEAEALIKNGK